MSSKREPFRDRLDTALRRRLPGCEGLVSAERLSGGASQETYRIRVQTRAGEQLVAMRRSSRPTMQGGVSQPVGLAMEAELFRAARAAGVPEPEIHFVLEPEDELGEGFVMEWLEGETLGARIVRQPELAELRPRLAYECGRVLAKIHAIDVQAAGLADGLERIAPDVFLKQMWERYQALDTPQPMIDYTARWLEEHLPRGADATLVHNDFRNGNLMVSPDGIVAVLDWEVAHVGDPMRDLGWICTNSWRFGRSDLPVGGFGAYEDLFRGYEEVSGKAVDPEHVRFWEVFGSFWWAIVCLGMVIFYRLDPNASVERPAIGRRTSESQIDCVNLLCPGPVDAIEPPPFESKLDMPRIDELVTSVRDHLRGEVMEASEGRARFLARVASNSLDIALRELAIGPEHRARELAGLRELLGRDGDDLETLRWELVGRLRDRSLPLDHPGLASHLRNTVANQVAIDQPKYSGLATALGWTEA